MGFRLWREVESAKLKTEVEGNKCRGMLGLNSGGAARKKRKEVEAMAVRSGLWACGACCKLDNGLAFPSPEDIFADDPFYLEVCSSPFVSKTRRHGRSALLLPA